MSVEVNITDNSAEYQREMENKQARILESWGVTCEAYAKLLTKVKTGRARSSVSHAVKGKDVYIGSNLDYYKWLELGTGIYASDGQGRQSPWMYYDENGNAHWTRGIKPGHMLKKAATEHIEELKAIAERISKE